MNRACVLRAGGWRRTGPESVDKDLLLFPAPHPHARSRRSIIWARLPSAGLLLKCTRVSVCSWPAETRSTTSHMCAHSVWAKVVTHLFWQSVDRETLVVVGKLHKRDCEFQSRNENTCKHQRWSHIKCDFSRSWDCLTSKPIRSSVLQIMSPTGFSYTGHLIQGLPPSTLQSTTINVFLIVNHVRQPLVIKSWVLYRVSVHPHEHCTSHLESVKVKLNLLSAHHQRVYSSVISSTLQVLWLTLPRGEP